MCKSIIDGIKDQYPQLDLSLKISYEGFDKGSLYSSPTSVTWSRFGCQLRWVHFSGPPHFGPLITFFGFFFAKFGFYGPKLLLEVPYEIK